VSVPFLSEIKIMSFGFPPKGWAQCNGQLLPINQNQALFSLLGTTYGGDGRTTFGLPNLQARTAIHFGGGYSLGQSGGEQVHTVTIGETPVHTHTAMGTPTTGDSPIPAGNYLGGADNFYAPLANTTAIAPTTVANAGGSQPHDNMQPYLCVTFIISLFGVFPSQT
jgi:microcystin-dependent protein